MKKFKLSALVVSILSLGIACNGFAFASEESLEIPDFNESPFYSGFVENATEPEEKINLLESDSIDSINWKEEMFLSQYGEILNSILNDLKDIISGWLPKTAQEFASLVFGKDADQFLTYLDSMIVGLVEEGKLDEAGVLNQLCAMAGNAIDSIL